MSHCLVVQCCVWSGWETRSLLSGAQSRDVEHQRCVLLDGEQHCRNPWSVLYTSYAICVCTYRALRRGFNLQKHSEMLKLMDCTCWSCLLLKWLVGNYVGVIRLSYDACCLSSCRFGSEVCVWSEKPLQFDWWYEHNTAHVWFSLLFHLTSCLPLELRRLNMRSIVGRKDVFLSYAHMNIQFAQQIKVLWCTVVWISSWCVLM